jgi:hypothetical protein
MGFPGDHHDSTGWGAPPPSQYGPAENAYGSDTSYDRPASSYGESPQGGFAYEGGPPQDPYGHGGLSYESSLYDRRSGPESPRPPGGSGGKRWLFVAAVGVAVVILGGGAGLMLTSGGGGPSTPTPTPTPTAATTTPTPQPTENGRGQRLQTRATDPRPLTLNEVFKHRRFKGGGRTYTMTVRRADRACARGTHGTAFRKLLKRGGCSQVLRATFSNGKLIGTIGVLNLRTQHGATVLQHASQPKDTFVMPLPGAGTTRKIGQGLSLTTAEVDGHYLIMSWIQYPNGKKIAQSDYHAVTAFVQYTTLGSNLRPALNYRSMVGKPA